MIAFHRSGAARLAALFLALFSGAVIIGFATAYWFVRDEVEDALRADVMSTSDALARRLSREPPDVAFATIRRQHTAALFAADGTLVIGDSGFTPFLGWREMPADRVHLDEPEDDRSKMALAFGRRLGEQTLVVGLGMDLLEDAGEAMRDGLLSSLAIVASLGLAGAALIAWRYDRRLGRVQDALVAYGSGDMSRRLPVGRSGDELDRMARGMNAVLDRLATVMETTRQVSADVAHDLKTPMTRLRHRLAEAEGASPEEVKDVIRAAAAEAEHIIDTFEALQRLSEIEAGARRARFDQVDLSDVLETVADAYGLDAEQTAHRIETAIKPQLHVRGDRELLTQAFANLVENAIRHSGNGASICVTAAVNGAGVEAVVSDNGPGVPESERERVLRRFGRLEASRSTPGTGLGLTLVNAIADLHGARLQLSDNRPGLKVTMTFDHPTGIAA